MVIKTHLHCSHFFSIFCLLGFVANLSVIWVIVRHSKARTARNLYIINLVSVSYSSWQGTLCTLWALN